MDRMEHLRARLEALEHHVKRLEVQARSVEPGPRDRGLDQRRSRSQRAWEALPGAFGHSWQISVPGRTRTKCFCGPRIVNWCACLRERRFARREIPSPKPAPKIL
jgi:hypothetical protein